MAHEHFTPVSRNMNILMNTLLIPSGLFLWMRLRLTDGHPIRAYSLVYPRGVTIASSGTPAAHAGQSLPRTKLW